MKVSVLTLGCKANQAESSIIEANLQSAGNNIVELSDKPDICVINTCTVTLKSDHESRQLIRKAHKAGSKVIVTGCYSELNKEKVNAMEGVAAVIDNNDKFSVINRLTGIGMNTALTHEGYRRSRFFLKVQDGCNFACSYCIIPKARGRSSSISIESIIEQVTALSDNYSEIVLIGIHLGTYGYDLTPKVKLSALIRAILTKTSIKRIRLSSLEINEVDDELIELLHDERLCNHLHIPLQSGDDRMLRLMNRQYDTRVYKSGIEKIHDALPEISIGTDIIAGFPGEGNEEFENTRRFIEALPLSYFHVFSFSPRTGTRASEMPMNIDPATKKDRSNLLIELGQRKKQAYMEKQIGRTLGALIEEVCADGSSTGITENYLRVRAYIKEPVVKIITSLRVDGYNKNELLGSVESSL